MSTDARVAAAIAGWHGGGVSDAARAFARAVVAGAPVRTPGRARALLFAAARLAAFAARVGLELRPEVVLHGSVIERFIGRAGSAPPTSARCPGGTRDISYEITEHDPPRLTRFRGTNGPVGANGQVTVEPLDDGNRSRVRVELDLRPHGLLGM